MVRALTAGPGPLFNEWTHALIGSFADRWWAAQLLLLAMAADMDGPGSRHGGLTHDCVGMAALLRFNVVHDASSRAGGSASSNTTVVAQWGIATYLPIAPLMAEEDEVEVCASLIIWNAPNTSRSSYSY